ncbi:beta-ketoacyl synthase N-terminal-like domain-containing protein [Amycolatopsis sp. WQ 127309]|uniref:beta-ketoacyl synthase N-terminal-like domain-containing protein n=1 Tax=Amycolatopsis sp. WQ 127309 TaxID=2932773 RepID=UPI001FF67C6A|nr:beta-ketoacyl synthase N-terminal-like domain-containing protein [Amycolatopsis sp. WQ 127309]UOZ06999.1 3-oxoacyl-ACP synthase [Amycolatopsis sp. WQ 127309]
MRLSRMGIRGIGAVSGYGWGIDDLWKGVISGETAARVHSGLGYRFPDPCWLARIPDDGTPANGLSRYARAYVSAADEAIRDAYSRGWQPGRRVAVLTATTRADQELLRHLTAHFDEAEIRRRAYVQLTWTTPAYEVMKKHDFHGPALVISAACTSGLHAMATAQRLITLGDATDVVVVGLDSGYNAETMRSFHELGPLHFDTHPADVCRPFQDGSRGFVIGEAAAAVVLSASVEDSYLSVSSTAFSSEAYHAVGIDPTHRMIKSTVDDALTDAEITATDVETYIAHATGTPGCARADEAVVAHLGTQVRAFGTKPLFGHCMAAANLLDTVLLARGHEEGFIPVPPPYPGAVRHPQLATAPLGPAAHTVQVGIGFGGNIGVAVYRAHQG